MRPPSQALSSLRKDGISTIACCGLLKPASQRCRHTPPGHNQGPGPFLFGAGETIPISICASTCMTTRSTNSEEYIPTSNPRQRTTKSEQEIRPRPSTHWSLPACYRHSERRKNDLLHYCPM